MNNTSKNFKSSELQCKCGCGVNGVKSHSLLLLQSLREHVGFPISLSSAYRCKSHKNEVNKVKGGTHNQGIAFDIKFSNSVERYKILQAAFVLGFTGIGISKTFIHVDTRLTTPVVWDY